MHSFSFICCILYLLFERHLSLSSALQRNADRTDLAREPDDRPLLFATLGGGMVALEQNTGNIIWTLKDEPVVKVPNENDQFDPQFLPDPRHGSLYMFGTHAGERQILKKLPFTIPQLVANAPCRSSDGILYTGKKIDTWFMIDPKTGIRKHILGHEKVNLFDETQTNTCPLDPKNAIYVARTEYNILMYDSKKENHRWNVTFFDYSSHNMGNDMLNSYGIVHFTSTSNGRVTSFDRKTGQMMWSLDMQSPVVAAYLLDRDGLISVPFNTVGDDTMDHIIEDVSLMRNGQGFQDSNIELFPSLYVGEHLHGLYALSSLVDKNTITISADGPQPLLLEGPTEGNVNDDQEKSNKYKIPPYKQNINIHYNIKKYGNEEVPTSYLLLGYYSVPEYAETNFRGLSKSTSISLPINYFKSDSMENTQLKLIMGPSSQTDDQNWFEIQNSSETSLQIDKKKKEIVIDDLIVNNTNIVNISKQSVASQTEVEGRTNDYELSWKLFYKSFYLWLIQLENKGILIFGTIVIGVVFMMFLYLRNQMLYVRQLSQSGSRYSNGTYNYNGQILTIPEELENGSIKVGKIIFHPEKVLGKGCDGTFVYRGTFENRDVAVKRLLPECFSFADREVSLLSESDTHINVVRYYCMEQDKLFRYIALELCAATLQDYVLKDLESEFKIPCLEVLKQATSGLSHLHSLDIVHRDIKPQNVLLSVPSNRSPVRVMISDFGLCKKLNIGRNSFSRRSGVTGTDGWIAPEILNGHRTTTSVDMFSLGCVFYFVLSKGIHPFGNVLERQAKILKGQYNLGNLSSTIPEEDVDLSICLIKAMLSSNPENRPSASVVRKYPLFWTKQEILTFLQDVSDRVEKDSPGGPLEYGGKIVVRGDWRGRVGQDVAADLRRYRSYSGDSVRDLLRAMRNKKHHYRDLSIEAQMSLGSIPNGFTSYWLQRFPKLLLHTWLQMQSYRNEVQISTYYDDSYEFNNKFITDEIELEDLKKYEYEVPPENNLFIKSRNFYDHVQGKKYKFRTKLEDRPINTDLNICSDSTQMLENLSDAEQSRFSPSKTLQPKDDDKRDKRKYYKPNKNYQKNNFNSQQTNDKQNSTDPMAENAIKCKKKFKKDESNIVWTLPNVNNTDK